MGEKINRCLGFPAAIEPDERNARFSEFQIEIRIFHSWTLIKRPYFRFKIVKNDFFFSQCFLQSNSDTRVVYYGRRKYTNNELLLLLLSLLLYAPCTTSCQRVRARAFKAQIIWLYDNDWYLLLCCCCCCCQGTMRGGGGYETFVENTEKHVRHRSILKLITISVRFLSNRERATQNKILKNFKMVTIFPLVGGR